MQCLVQIVQGKKYHGFTRIWIENVTCIGPVFTQHWYNRSVSENFLLDKGAIRSGIWWLFSLLSVISDLKLSVVFISTHNQSQKAVTAYFTSNHLLHFRFTVQYSSHDI